MWQRMMLSNLCIAAIENVCGDCFSSACIIEVKLPYLVPNSAQLAQQARSQSHEVVLTGPQLQL